MYKKVYQFILGQGGFEQGCCCCSLKWQLYRAASSVVRSQALDLVCVPSPQDTEQLPQLDHGVTTLPPTISNNHDLRYMTWWESESCSRHVRRPMLGLARTLLHPSVNRSMAWMIDQDWVSDWSSDWLSDWLRKWNVLPGHPMQERLSESSPGQGFPPCSGAGFVHVLVLVSWPGPQVLEHWLHCDQSDQAPSTATNSSNYLMHSLHQHFRCPDIRVYLAHVVYHYV